MIKPTCFPESYLLAAAEHKQCVISAAAGFRSPLWQVLFEGKRTKAIPAPHLREITFGHITDV